MRRLLPLVVLIAVLSAACSPVSSGSTSTLIDETTTSSEDATGSTVDGSATTSPDSTTAPPSTVSDRPIAPDFTLALGDGGTYTLSEGEKPVYLVFWAEW